MELYILPVGNHHPNWQRWNDDVIMQPDMLSYVLFDVYVVTFHVRQRRLSNWDRIFRVAEILRSHVRFIFNNNNNDKSYLIVRASSKRSSQLFGAGF